tara:strand:+ start:1806 stop:2183 length:378 start_codon:yes stop_codon:yes gene_type:complete
MEDLTLIYNQKKYNNLELYTCNICNLKFDKDFYKVHINGKRCEQRRYINCCIYCGVILNTKCKTNHLKICDVFKRIYINNINNIEFLKSGIVSVNLTGINDDGFNMNAYRAELFLTKILQNFERY